MVEKANDVEKAFNDFRAKVDGKEMTDNEVRKVLKDVRRLGAPPGSLGGEQGGRRGGRKRPEGTGQAAQRGGARQLGFKNYHALQLYLNEQNGDDLIKLFDELDELTREPFRAAKAEIDARLAARRRHQGRAS